MATRFYNSMTRKVEDFLPQVAGEVRMYNCGPTVYSSPHIGNFRSFLLADLLRRFLESKGLRVTQVMNLTDVGHLTDDEHEAGEDKMEAASRRQKKTAWEIAEHYTREFFDACRYLSIRPAHHYPKATDHVPEMIEIIQRLVDRGFAYVTPQGNVYFQVEKFPRYGELSGNRGDDLRAGHRVEVNPEKRDPRDFALWKIDPHHQMQWDSPFGRGFPGWHIECSAMSRKYLGDTIDIHTGGEDNLFPHHECEIAQSEAFSGQAFVRYWIHGRHLLVDGKKMSKRLGNFYTLADLRALGYRGDAVRLALQKAHYREPLNFTLAVLDETARKVERYRDLKQRLEEASGESAASADVEASCSHLEDRFEAALDDDLNVSVALAVLDELVSDANRRGVQGGDARRVLATFQGFLEVFGLGETTEEAPADAVDEEALALLRERDEARARKDFATSDRLRDELKTRGYDVVDTKEGTRLKKIGT